MKRLTLCGLALGLTLLATLAPLPATTGTALAQQFDYGDAPEDAVAYPGGTIGKFPTCLGGSVGFIRHANAANGPLTFGASLVGMGDVDGDGRPDVLVSDPADSIGDEMPRGQSPGSLQAFSGRTHVRLWQRFGEQQLQCLGRSLSRVGDLDGDGIADAAARCVFGDTLCVLVSGRTGTVLGRIPRP